MFRQYFADPKGGTVTQIVDRSAGHGAKKANVYTHKGAVIPALARETILGEALWPIPADDFPGSLEAIKAMSNDAIEITLER